MHLGGGCRVDGGDLWMSAHMGPPHLRVLCLSPMQVVSLRVEDDHN